jgi:hypothetical protein
MSHGGGVGGHGGGFTHGLGPSAHQPAHHGQVHQQHLYSSQPGADLNYWIDEATRRQAPRGLIARLRSLFRRKTG